MHDGRFVGLFGGGSRCRSVIRHICHRVAAMSTSTGVAVTADGSRTDTVGGRLNRGTSVYMRPYHHSAFPTVTLTTTCLRSRLNISRGRTIIIYPISPCMSGACCRTIGALRRLTRRNNTGLALVNVRPACPDRGCNCVVPRDNRGIDGIGRFGRGPSIRGTGGCLTRDTL